MGRVRTVTGWVRASDLGPTYCHEHLLTDPAPWLTGADRDLTLDDETRAVTELRDFAGDGGRGLIEVSTREFGRNPAGLARLADATGVHLARRDHPTAFLARLRDAGLDDDACRRLLVDNPARLLSWLS